MSRKFPIGIQDFARIREDDYYYVDKTAKIHELLTGSGSAFFLSRPRRFGKSLLCSTLGAVFEGRRELFAGLAIDSLEWEWKKHPVIRIDLNPGDYRRGIEELYATINTALEIRAEKYNVPFEGETISDRFMRLIINLFRACGERVAVIIDEYDKPLLETIDSPEIHKQMRSALKGFYGVLKSADEYLQFVFLTGVTKFSQVSIFSDLNHLKDISLDSRYGTLCGITHEELERDFPEEIDQAARHENLSREAYLAELKRFYNGYRFSENPITVYNPFGLLNHFDKNGEFLSYWYETGTPTLLVKLIENQKIDIVNLEKKTVRYEDFRKYDSENMDAVPVLYQTGYLTIVDYDREEKEFVLDYPNEEVRSSFAKSLIALYVHVPNSDLSALSVLLPKMLRKGNIDGAMDALIPFFASIPYDITLKYEKYYQTVVYLVFRMLGMYTLAEVKTATGRIDAQVEAKNNVYCFEFKLDGSAEEALKQIDEKEYLLPWKGSGKKLYKVGVNFDSSKRNIGGWKYCIEG
jgi:hypothetical protein